MCKICVFAGTAEGRRLVEVLTCAGAEVTACVATEYGESLIKPAEGLTVSAKRMDGAEMERMLKENNFDCVVDATHPYAAEASKNIEEACKNARVRRIRLTRETGGNAGVTVDSAEEAAKFLSQTEGNILLTTGSKELGAFACIPDFSERVYARVLPMQASLDLCEAAGVKPSHIIAMQGPFSYEMNLAQLKSVSAKFMVTKDTGAPGGMEEKLRAAAELGVRPVTIGRPLEEHGFPFDEALEIIMRDFGLSVRQSVALVGVGVGTEEGLTGSAAAAIAKADIVIGAERMLKLAPGKLRFKAVASDEIVEYIREHKGFLNIAVLLSGDAGFYSGAKKLLPKLDFCDVTVIPGVSSLAYLCAKAGASYEDAVSVSLHGRDGSIVPAVKRNRLVFALVGGENGAGKLIGELNEAGLGNVNVTVGERLGYPDERITEAPASELAGRVFDPLSAVLIENAAPESAAHGLPDEAFLRNAADKPVVPMTKSEVRAVVLSKLRLTPDCVSWDIGAGTGSVSVEMALAAPRGKVYAIEKKTEAIGLLKENITRFGVKNVEVIEGSAPEICRGLPAPTHAFIGGSSGNMREIITLLLDKNPTVRIVAAAVSLETVSELTACMKEFGFTDTEAVSIGVAKARPLAGYNLMTAQNPVYIFTMQRA